MKKEDEKEAIDKISKAVIDGGKKSTLKIFAAYPTHANEALGDKDRLAKQSALESLLAIAYTNGFSDGHQYATNNFTEMLVGIRDSLKARD